MSVNKSGTEPVSRAVAVPYNRTESQMLLIRVVLGLNPVHDPVEAVRVLYEQGREAFERLRGEPCEYAAEWVPLNTREPS